MHRTSLITLGALALSGLAFAAPVSQNGTLLTRQDIDCDCPSDGECYYGAELTLDDYKAYLQTFYPAVDHYLLYSGGSVKQASNFKDNNAGYYYYEDFFDSSVSEHYLTQWPVMTDAQGRGDCYRPDNGEASSVAIAQVAAGEIRVFGAVEYLTKGPNSFFATKEAPELRKSINAGTLGEITHMIKDATSPSDVLATEDANMVITYADGQEEGTPNASGPFGDCSMGDDPPCDDPSNYSPIHE